MKEFSRALLGILGLAGLLLAAGAGFLAPEAGASTRPGGAFLRAYSPGGPHHVLEECAELYRSRQGVTVEVDRASPAELARRIEVDGDLYFGGAEYMLEDFVRRNPRTLDLETVERLHPRRIGIMVRKGNPLGITGPESLRREGVDLLTARLENMAPFHAQADGPGGSVRVQVQSGQEGVRAWRSRPELDAWVTYRSWHVGLEGEADFIEIPGDDAVRFTPAALTRRTAHREAALQFIEFLKSPEARQIFVGHGWE